MECILNISPYNSYNLFHTNKGNLSCIFGVECLANLLQKFCEALTVPVLSWTCQTQSFGRVGWFCKERPVQ